VLPSIEAFEMRLELPAVHMVFYDFFFKSSVGDSQWKASCLEAKDDTDRLAPPQGEAFTMLVLKNNYFAWLWEAKSSFKNDLASDYDYNEPLHGKKVFIGEAFLPKTEINLDRPEGALDDKKKTTAQFGEKVLVREGAPLFQQLRRNTRATIKEARQKARESQKYQHLKKQLEEQEGEGGEHHHHEDNEEDKEDEDDDEGGQQDNSDAAAEQRIKRRKVLKSFREYTNPKEDEGKFKGWSHRASSDMAKLQAAVKADEDKGKLFRAAYRLTYRNRHSSAKKKKAIQESADVNYEKEIWDLPDIVEVEI
jgi:hypothetical protein